MGEAAGPRRRVFRRVMVYLLLALVVYVAFVWLVQRRVLFPTWAIPAGLRAEPPAGAERIWIETPAGKTEAWWIPGDGVQSPTSGVQSPESRGVLPGALPGALPGELPGAGAAVIFAHGNGEVIDLWPPMLRGYTRMGLGVLLVEFRGYGRSDGAPSQAAITDDFVAAYDLLAKLPGVDPERIVLHGRSVGGGVAAAVAARREPAAVILESSFTGVAPLARRYLVPRFLVRDPFDTLGWLRGYRGPVLILHGKEDAIIPVGHAHDLAAVAEDATLVVFEGMDHNSGPPSEADYWAAIRGFLHAEGVLSGGGGDPAGPASEKDRLLP